MLPIWVQYLQSLLTPTIALAVGIIAYRQWKTAHSKLVLDLFEKRLDVYRHVRSAVSVVNTTGKTSREAELALLEAINAAEFLFGDDVRSYLEGMWHRFIKMNAANAMIEGGDTPEVRRSNIEAQSRLLNEITQFYYEGSDVFAPYMRMEHRLRPPLKTRRQRPAS
ncbi:hypothetical protein RFM41_12105 [Mesorhizobium sp. VK25A]|uniref:DUF4760 domain-containing protein n=1 Tax=Mesorhizobium vachelliae TaxID=3072309 RepID=A0ABU4ZXF2_9HYPH|nr:MULTISPECIES: hypothetical protein [unclassified Mesorhizobium]MDX8530086.1 hypothetical protein [Mesorhizobium sp. VK25D]MDX8544484.1 hypothetical protein [Mesorhizobium sp. VK25A]